MDDKRQTVILLRWVLIIASAYLLLFNPEATSFDLGCGVLVAMALGSNIVLNHLPQRWWEWRGFDMALVVFDTAWVTASLAWSHSSDDFFMLYFLVLFVAALGESLPTIVASATVITALYGWGLNHAFGYQVMTSATFLRMVFLFVVGLFYGYFVNALRGKRHEAAEARALERAKTDLFTAISHDLRAPMGNAENYAMLLLGGTCGDLPERAREFVARLQANIRRASTLVSNCLDASRIEDGRLHLQRNPLELNEVVTDVLQLEASQARSKGITLRSHLSPGLPRVLADMMHVGRIISNLVGNALKYTPNGGFVEVHTRAGDDGVYLEVSDSGPGIRPEEQATVFEKYERLKNGKDQPGTGLGLFIVKTIVRAHGGTIKLKSALGRGATFVVWLPAGDVEDSEPRLQLAPVMPQDVAAARAA
jgi:signal transduction histidine kinase